MDTAIVGFLGVVAGAVTTGGVQAGLAYLGRRNNSLAAARLIYGSLIEVDQSLAAVADAGRIPASMSFKRQLDMWDAQKEDLARVLDVVDYQLIQAAFSNAGYIEDALQDAKRVGDPDGGLARVRKDPGHSARVSSIQEAETIALKASRRVVDRLKSRRHQKRLAELLAHEGLLPGLQSEPKET